MSDAVVGTTADPAAEEAAAAEETVTEVHGCPVTVGAGQQTSVHVPRDQYLKVLGALKKDGYGFLTDVTAVDELTHAAPRRLPDGVAPERYEVVVNLLDMAERRRIRVRVQVPESDPTIPSLFDLWPGADAMEREAYDLMGIVFTGHPDLTRILMPDDWEGHPLRKDYAVGRIPVQFKAAPQPR